MRSPRSQQLPNRKPDHRKSDVSSEPEDQDRADFDAEEAQADTYVSAPRRQARQANAKAEEKQNKGGLIPPKTKRPQKLRRSPSPEEPSSDSSSESEDDSGEPTAAGRSAPGKAGSKDSAPLVLSGREGAGVGSWADSMAAAETQASRKSKKKDKNPPKPQLTKEQRKERRREQRMFGYWCPNMCNLK